MAFVESWSLFRGDLSSKSPILDLEMVVVIYSCLYTEIHYIRFDFTVFQLERWQIDLTLFYRKQSLKNLNRFQSLDSLML